jgi:GNAT superfamily N-acetyltransferase
MVGFRLAEVEDAQNISMLIEQCFQDGPANNRQLEAGLANGVDRAVTLAVSDEEPIGFVAGFTTLSPEGFQRWEIDLLAVRPGYQGQGIGRQLINASVELGRRSGAVLARALIQEKNAASQRAFVSQGFIASEPMVMYRWEPSPQETTIARFNVITEPHSGTISVNTLTYRGLWLEGKLTERIIQTAKQRIFMIKEELTTVGTIVPRRENETIQLLQHCHFTEIDAYRFWQKRF